MANKLKIYACSGIGDAGEQRGYSYWMDNTNTISNTQAVNTLLSLINLKYSEIQYLRNITDDEINKNLNAIDLYSVSLMYAESMSNNIDGLKHAGQVIGTLYANGLFNYDSIDENERDLHLDEIFDKVSKAMQDNEMPLAPADDFVKWWNSTIIERNKVGLTDRQQSAITEAMKDGKIGASWQDNKELAQYLNNAGDYFLYTYFTDEQVNQLPRVFKTKRKQQKKVYNYCLPLFETTSGDKSQMDRIIRAKLVERYGEQPETICQLIVDGKIDVSGIGEAVTVTMVGTITLTEFLTILTTIVIPALIAIITAICDAVAKSKASQFAAIDQMAIDGGCPNANDFDGLLNDMPNANKPSDSKLLAIAAGLVGLFLIFRK